MRALSPRTTLFIAVVILVGIYAFISVATAQSTYTSTLTQVTNVYSTNIILTTLTSPTIVYTTATKIWNSTIVGTRTVWQPSLITGTSTYTTIVSATVTEAITAIVTQVVTETTQLLGNIWGESIALILLAAALASYVVPKLHSRPPTGVVCSKCGNRNPPFARTYCVKCGHSLKDK
jgi:ribosomal protein L40E